MAVEKPPKLASQFWPNFLKKKITLLILSQLFISLVIGFLLVFAKIFTINSIILWSIVGIIFVLCLSVNLMILFSATRPTKDLLAAIINISGERTTLTPPNPNVKKYAKTGFRDALQTIYTLSSNKEDSASEPSTPKPDNKISFLNSALDTTICGFVALNNQQAVVYSNKSAPVHIDQNGVQTLDLLFNGSDTLKAWLEECNDHSLRAEHVWTRIPDRLPNLEGRRFFDVFASYEKGMIAETVLTLVDRTDNYIIDEENLDFISFAAHELRGPITVIRGYLDVLEDELSDVLKDDQHELFHRLVVSSNRLTGYINNILNTSRYDRRHLKMHLVEGTIKSVYEMISDDMQLRANSQNRLLTVSFPTDLPTVAVDVASMSEVFGNLIDNAIKYSNEGGAINVTAKAAGDFVEVVFQDNGIGMPESVVSNLFQKFYRSHRSRETVAGTGIGLYISKAIVESHGGTISVRSEDGKGSTFVVSIPTYLAVADKLQASDNSNEGLISEGKGWINNHSMFRG